MNEGILKLAETDKSQLTSLADYLKKGGQLTQGMNLIFERRLHILEQITAEAWDTKKDDADKYHFGYYPNSTVTAIVAGKAQKFPFSMLYVSNQQASNV